LEFERVSPFHPASGRTKQAGSLFYPGRVKYPGCGLKETSGSSPECASLIKRQQPLFLLAAKNQQARFPRLRASSERTQFSVKCIHHYAWQNDCYLARWRTEFMIPTEDLPVAERPRVVRAAGMFPFDQNPTL
jgi:hypothetical protein